MSPIHNSGTDEEQGITAVQLNRNNFGDRFRSIPPERIAWLWLVVGFLLLPFTAWQIVIPLAAWLAPVFLLRFARTCNRPRLVMPLIFAAYAGSMLIDLRHGQGDLWAWFFAILMLPVIRGLLYTLPYLADRRIGSRLGHGDNGWSSRWPLLP